MTRKMLCLMLMALAVGLAADNAPWYWRMLRCSHFETNMDDRPTLAPSNGWTVCRDNSGRLHVVFTEPGSGQSKVYWRCSDDLGATWSEAEQRSANEGSDAARDAVAGPEPFSAPAGDYDRAWRVRESGPLSGTADVWYIRGVGETRRRTEIRTGGRLLVQCLDLVSYEVRSD